MGFVRALQVVIVLAVVAAGGLAHAAPALCDGDDALVSLSPAQLRSPAVGAPAARDVDDEPPVRELCRPGRDDQAGCRPYQPLPAPSRSAGPLATESFVLVHPPVVPPPDSCGAPAACSAAFRLAPGFARRVDRPPRAS